MEHFDAIVIGTGQAGKPLAGALGKAGLRTAIIEKGRVGGTCVIDGCTPTKTMVASARVAHLARRAADYGVRVGDVEVDLEVVRRRKREMVDAWSSGGEKGLGRIDAVDLVFGTARFTGPKEIEVTLPDGGARAMTADRVFINTGTRNRVLDLDGLDSVPWLDNASLMELAEVPEHLVILGGGFIGLEFAQMFRRFGSRVTVVEASDRIAPREDDDIRDALREILGEDGIDFRCGELASEARAAGRGVEVRLGDAGWDAGVRGTHLMVAVGRVPNADDLGLEKTEVERTERGFIRVDDGLRTSADGIWALGDVNGGPPFTHIAYDDYRVVRENVLGVGGASRADRIVPYTLFTDPQLGRVGLTEREAREKGYEVAVAKMPMSRAARAVETDETRGLMKAVVDAGTGRILGASILGVEGGEIASAIQIAMMGGLTYRDLRDSAFSHPTLTESLNNLFATIEE
jgi:pyruvate/2-oxoglutarate dehydrogenase complex dihydrolipoamide dehydrogenase (E3) component